MRVLLVRDWRATMLAVCWRMHVANPSLYQGCKERADVAKFSPPTFSTHPRALPPHLPIQQATGRMTRRARGAGPLAVNILPGSAPSSQRPCSPWESSHSGNPGSIPLAPSLSATANYLKAQLHTTQTPQRSKEIYYMQKTFILIIKSLASRGKRVIQTLKAEVSDGLWHYKILFCL